MNKLEEKLIELGYELIYARRPDIWEKDFNENIIIRIYTKLGNGIKRSLCIKYIQSGFDLGVLKNA